MHGGHHSGSQRGGTNGGRFDKSTYSPWIDGRLHRQLQEEHVTTLVVTAGETGVCILATVLGAVDLGPVDKVGLDACE